MMNIQKLKVLSFGKSETQYKWEEMKCLIHPIEKGIPKFGKSTTESCYTVKKVTDCGIWSIDFVTNVSINVNHHIGSDIFYCENHSKGNSPNEILKDFYAIIFKVCICVENS